MNYVEVFLFMITCRRYLLFAREGKDLVQTSLSTQETCRYENIPGSHLKNVYCKICTFEFFLSVNEYMLI